VTLTLTAAKVRSRASSYRRPKRSASEFVRCLPQKNVMRSRELEQLKSALAQLFRIPHYIDARKLSARTLRAVRAPASSATEISANDASSRASSTTGSGCHCPTHDLAACFLELVEANMRVVFSRANVASWAFASFAAPQDNVRYGWDNRSSTDISLRIEGYQRAEQRLLEWPPPNPQVWRLQGRLKSARYSTRLQSTPFMLTVDPLPVVGRA
jgi:hypothetical protein